MKKFSAGQRIKVTVPSHPLFGKVGHVHRIRKADDGAWVMMRDPLPESLTSFPEEDPRHHDVILYPKDCSLEAECATTSTRPT